MKKIKKGTLKFDKDLPYDCWSHVVTFLLDHQDFLSICLVIKGFYEYVKNVNPGCCQNVQFAVQQNISSSQTKLKYVRHIIWNEFSPPDFSLGFNSHDTRPKRRPRFNIDQIALIFSSFPSLTKLVIGVGQEGMKKFSEECANLEKLRNLELKLTEDVKCSEELFIRIPSLESLLLLCVNCEVKFDFPKLRSIENGSVCFGSKGGLRQVDQGPDPFRCWKNQIPKTLERIDYNLKLTEESPKSFNEDLRKLITNNRRLKDFKFDVFVESTQKEDFKHIEVEFDGFQNLEVFTFSFFEIIPRSGWFYNEEEIKKSRFSTVTLLDLPKLKRVSIVGVRILKLKNTRSLEYFAATDCEDIEIIHQLPPSLKILEFRDTAMSQKNLEKYTPFIQCTKLEELKLSVPFGLNARVLFDYFLSMTKVNEYFLSLKKLVVKGVHGYSSMSISTNSRSIDLSAFPKLEKLVLTFWNSLRKVSNMENLRSLKIENYLDEGDLEISDLPKLEILKLIVRCNMVSNVPKHGIIMKNLPSLKTSGFFVNNESAMSIRHVIGRVVSGSQMEGYWSSGNSDVVSNEGLKYIPIISEME